MSDGSVPSTSAMLSKPYASLSFGSSALALTCNASKSRIALPYSVRFKRCSALRPGFGLAAAAASS
jgi:hypothetical protein